LKKNRYIPFLSIEDNKSQWMLIEIDINQEVIVIYNPRNSDDKHEKKVLHAISNTVGEEVENRWTIRRCTSIRHQTREEESGVFVAAWIKTVIYSGEVNNCIGSSQVKLFRSEIYNDLKARNYGKDRGEKALDAVLQYRKTFINGTEEVEGSIPEEILAVQTEYLKAITRIDEDECNGRHLVLMKGLKKGDILGFYFGTMLKGEGSDEKNEYNLKLEHLDENGGAYVDGTPGANLDDYRLSLINGDYTETMTMHNCSIDEFGRIVMTKKTRKGRKLMMHYGIDDKGLTSYNWERLDIFLVETACKKTIKLTGILTDVEKYQLENAMIEKNEIYEIMRNMVLHNTKSRVRHKKPTSLSIEDTLNYLYSMKIYRDWVTKQRSEEGIARQMTLDEKDIEVEERMIRGTRCSLRLKPMTNENETENDISEKEISKE
jgi:hypothetical protein